MIKKFFYNMLPYLLILTGITFITLPYARNYYRTMGQKQLIQNWEDMQTDQQSTYAHSELVHLKMNIDKSDRDSTPPDLSSAHRDENVRPIKIQDKNNHLFNQLINKLNKYYYDPADVSGLLVIDKIQLKLPILKYNTEKHLDLSVVQLSADSYPGQPGNFSIVGHRSHQYGKIFHRLDELVLGDMIKVIGHNNITYAYKVISKEIVKSTDVWVLDSTDTQEVTLITCHPLYQKNPTHRLVIKGEIIKTQ